MIARCIDDPAPEKFYDSSLLWDISDSTSPIRTDLSAEFIKEQTGKRSVGGVTSYAGPFRDKLRTETFVPEQNAIPAQEVVLQPKTCAQRHPGLCPARDGDHYITLLTAAVCLQKWFIAHVDTGSTVKLAWGDGPDSKELILVIAYIRKGNPEVVVSAVYNQIPENTEFGDTYMDVAINKEGLCPLLGQACTAK